MAKPKTCRPTLLRMVPVGLGLGFVVIKNCFTSQSYKFFDPLFRANFFLMTSFSHLVVSSLGSPFSALCLLKCAVTRFESADDITMYIQCFQCIYSVSQIFGGRDHGPSPPQALVDRSPSPPKSPSMMVSM